MSDYDNTIVLFKNERYEQGGKHPMYKGNATFNGQQLNCSVWLKEANGDGKLEKGTKFFSGTFDDWKPDASKGNGGGSRQSAPAVELDDIPF